MTSCHSIAAAAAIVNHSPLPLLSLPFKTIASNLVRSGFPFGDLWARDSSPIPQLIASQPFNSHASALHVILSTISLTHYTSRYGFTISGDKACPIVPVMLGDARLAAEFADEMLERGVYVIGFSYPVVPKDTARIRTQISAAHTKEQLQHSIDAFVEVGRLKGVIS